MKNMCARMTGIRQIEIEECAMPTPKPGEILIQVEYVGICGSDVHFYTHGRIGKKVIDRPFILGHEAAGTVVAVAPDVSSVKIGDRVALEPGLPCGRCKFCKSGRYNLCPSVAFLASPPTDGALRKYMTYPAHMAFVLPPQISSLAGALLEPLAVALHAAERGEATLGDTVTILGAGCIGLLTLLACRARGAARIIVADIVPGRLEKALAMGADETVCAKDCDTVAELLRLTDGIGTDLVFETAGSSATMRQTAKIVGRGGQIVMVGNVTTPTEYEFHELSVKEADIKTVFRYCNLYPTAIKALQSGSIDLSALGVTVFAFEQTQEAFLATCDGASGITKSAIKL